MSRSLEGITSESEWHVEPSHPETIESKTRTHVVSVENGRMWHREQMFDLAGNEIYDQSYSMRYVVGSGRRAKAYLHQRGDLLLMSPLNWYSQERKWDFAPSYAPDDYRRFDRRVTEDCLGCHSGRVASLGRGLNRYHEPAFREESIGCENCHGPGKDHIAFYRSGGTDPAADPIVNPAELEPARRESVCYQCHLPGAVRVPRHGRSHLDFRPGMRFDEIWTVLADDAARDAKGRSRAVSHVQQMRSSRCYTASGERLGCISCHDPHRVPAESERVAFYRNRCNACHHDAGCSVPLMERAEKENSCIACHMPPLGTTNISHVTQTDHRVLKSYDAASESSPAAKEDSLTFFDDAHLRLAGWERDRALGLGAYLYLSRSGRDLPAPLIRKLDDVLKTVPEDGEVLTTLGAIALDHERLDLARDYFERARAIPAAKEAALGGLLKVYYLSSNWNEALACAEWLVKLNPGDYRAQAMRADVLVHLGRLPEGIAAAETALRFNPTLVELRRTLVGWYRDAGETEESQRQREILDRMEKVLGQ